MDIDNRMVAFVEKLFKEELSTQYAYHNFAHSVYVMKAAAQIGAGEGLDKAAEQRILTTAGLWHDTGFTVAYSEHEIKGCILTQKYLPEFGFLPSEIELINGMIMATRIPQTPINLYDQVLADADLCYLGTPDAGPFATNLYEELSAMNPGFTATQWQERQISFLSGHRFWTSFAKSTYAKGKLNYLSQLTQPKKD